MEVTFLWIQGQVQAKSLKVQKIRGEKNPADLLTKPKYFKQMREHFGRVGIRVEPASMNCAGLEEECQESTR